MPVGYAFGNMLYVGDAYPLFFQFLPVKIDPDIFFQNPKSVGFIYAVSRPVSFQGPPKIDCS